MLHSFDASSFVWAGRRFFPQYPRDVFPSVWKALAREIQGDSVFICQEAFDETAGGDQDDDLAKWLRERRAQKADCVRKSNTAALNQAAEIIARFPGLPDKDRELDADPYIIAHAIVAGGAAVVTQEIPKNIGQHGHKTPDNQLSRIPDVCKRLGIECMDLSEFMRRKGMRF